MPDAGVARRRGAGIVFMANATDCVPKPAQRAGEIIGRAVVVDGRPDGPVVCRDILAEDAPNHPADDVSAVPNRDDDVDSWHRIALTYRPTASGPTRRCVAFPMPIRALVGKAARILGLNIESKLDVLPTNNSFDIELRNRFQYLEDTSLAKRRISELTQSLVPCSAKSFSKIRLGNLNDGGYVCIDDFTNIAAALSLGISDDVSWDLEIANRSIRVAQYDHTVDAPQAGHPAFLFFKQKIGSAEDGGITIAEIIARHQIVDEASAILKIDIEHAEWNVFDQTTDDTLSHFAQIIGEFHGFDEVLDDDWFDRAKRIFARLGKQFGLVHVHGNNCAAQLVLDNMLFPRSLELTFANRGRYALVESQEYFPGPLDAPNDPKKPDCGLGQFRYCFGARA